MKNKITLLVVTILSSYLFLLEAEQAAPLLQHVALIHELKQKFAPKPAPRSVPIAQVPTQTEAYLSRFQNEVNERWNNSWHGDFLTKHHNLITTALQREKEFSESHYALYHAHRNHLKIVQDVIKKLHMYLTLVPLQDFTFMRMKKLQTAHEKDVNEYIKKQSFGGAFDHQDFVRAQMISVNLSLFGNRNSPGECTFDYFVDNNSQAYILKDILRDLLSPFGFGHAFVETIVHELWQISLSSPTGILHQIFIPKELIDKVVYLSEPCGIPYSKKIVSKYFDSKTNHHTRIAPILDKYRTNPQSISDLDDLQARLVFLDPLFDPSSGIKFFTYDTIAAEDKEKYDAAINQIVQKIILEYVSNRKKREADPLVKLYDYMQPHVPCINVP
jgi:hypothetical protein